MSRQRLIDRVPEIWLRLDRNLKVLERYFSSVDWEYDRVHDKIGELFALRNVDLIPDRYLRLLAPLVGHVWRSDRPHQWNRSRVRDSIRRWSYKGTLECVGDIVRENGGSRWRVVDQASRLVTLDVIGHLSEDDCYFESADYWHEGAFLLFVDPKTDLAGLLADLELVRQAGTRWYVSTEFIFPVQSIMEGGLKLRGRLVFSPNDFAFDVGELDNTLFLDGWHSNVPMHMVTRLVFDTVIFGGSITMDSTTWLMDRDDITLSMGVQPASPLSLPLAAQQPAFLLTTN